MSKRTFPIDLDTADRVQVALKEADYRVKECASYAFPNKWSAIVVTVPLGNRTFQVVYNAKSETADLVREEVPMSTVDVWSR